MYSIEGHSLHMLLNTNCEVSSIIVHQHRTTGYSHNTPDLTRVGVTSLSHFQPVKATPSVEATTPSEEANIVENLDETVKASELGSDARNSNNIFSRITGYIQHYS